MDVYRMTECPKCKNVFDINEDSETIMVHGIESLEKFLKMIKEGKKIKEIKKEFCGCCGGHIPCGCDDSYSQC